MCFLGDSDIHAGQLGSGLWVECVLQYLVFSEGGGEESGDSGGRL